MSQAVTGAPTITAILLMIVNDHALKGSGVIPSVLTGKLSDFAFLFFGPILTVYLARARTRWQVGLAFLSVAVLFAAINVSQTASDLFAFALSTILPSSNVCDVEDLVALVILPLPWAYLWRKNEPQETSPDRHSPRLGARRRSHWVAMLASIGCLATGYGTQPKMTANHAVTHRVVYMTWKELRTNAVKVREPKPIGTRGKLVIADRYLFLSEPGEGVHIFDNVDPKNPEALLFIRIPGNIDIAIRDGQLYADSFVDLLVFDLDLPNRQAKLAHRLEDQFEYNPYQMLPGETPVSLGPVDRSIGVVYRLHPNYPTNEDAQ